MRDVVRACAGLACVVLLAGCGSETPGPMAATAETTDTITAVDGGPPEMDRPLNTSCGELGYLVRKATAPTPDWSTISSRVSLVEAQAIAGDRPMIHALSQAADALAVSETAEAKDAWTSAVATASSRCRDVGSPLS